MAGERVDLPAAVKMSEITHGKQYDEKLKCIPLSADPVGRWLKNTAKDLNKQILEKITQCERRAIQLDESRVVWHGSAYGSC